MSLNDPLSNVLSKILNAEKIGKKTCLVKPASKEIRKVLTIFNEHGYLGKFKVIEDGKGGILEVNLMGNINKCGVIKPKFSTKHMDLEKWEKRYLPANDFGVIILTTPKGYLTHTKAKEEKTGGRMVAYCY